MTPEERKADVAAVVAEAMRESHENVIADHSSCFLAAITAAGYAVVKVPEGVAVEHGARLVVGGRWNNVYAIEAP